MDWEFDTLRRALWPERIRFGDVLVIGLAVIMFAITWPTMFAMFDIPAPLAPIFALVTVAPLLLTRSAPTVGWALSVGYALCYPLLGFRAVEGYAFPWTVPHLLVLLFLTGVVTLREPVERVTTAIAVTAVAFWVDVPDGVVWAVGVILGYAFIALIRWLTASRRALAQQEELSELERARRAVAEERTRIARDLHDVVAHQISMIVVQAQSAPYRLATLDAPMPEATAGEFDAIADAARGALDEIRGLLGVLRSDEAAVTPQPGLAELESLVEATRRAGVELEWSTEGDAASVPATVAVAVYRIVQESLANAVRHAPGARVSARLAFAPGVVHLQIDNPTTVDPAPSTTGSGIVSMTERAAAVGGTVEAGEHDGCFTVRAELPFALWPPAPGTEPPDAAQ